MAVLLDNCLHLVIILLLHFECISAHIYIYIFCCAEFSNRVLRLQDIFIAFYSKCLNILLAVILSCILCFCYNIENWLWQIFY